MSGQDRERAFDRRTFTQWPPIQHDFANGGNIKGMIAAATTLSAVTNAKAGSCGSRPWTTSGANAVPRPLWDRGDRLGKAVKDGKKRSDVVRHNAVRRSRRQWASTELAGKNFCSRSPTTARRPAEEKRKRAC